MIFNFESCLGIPIPHAQTLCWANIHVYQRTVLIIPGPHPEMTSVVLFLLLTFEENLWSQFQFLF